MEAVRAYACNHEGQLVTTIQDRQFKSGKPKNSNNEMLAGSRHILSALSDKTKTVAHSTLTEETSGAFGVVNASQMIAQRLTELHISSNKPQGERIEDMMNTHENGQYILKVDHCTDCNGTLELVRGLRDMPANTQQRLLVNALRGAIVTPLTIHPV